MIEIHPEIKDAIRKDSLILFIGSGYSRNLNLPNWNELVNLIIQKLPITKEKINELESIKSPIDRLERIYKIGLEFESKCLLKEIIDINIENCNLENQRLLWQITKKIITTNYDKSIEMSVKEIETFFEIYTQNSRFITLSSFLYKIHGTIDNVDNCILFKNDYRFLYNLNHQFLNNLRTATAKSTLLFVGYSMSDREIKEILKNVREIFPKSTKHFLLSPSDNNLKKFGVETIKINNYAEVIPYLQSLAGYRFLFDEKIAIIRERVNEKHSSEQWFIRDSKFEKEKDKFLLKETCEDILYLEKFEETNSETDAKIKCRLKEEGKLKNAVAYLLKKREANYLSKCNQLSNIDVNTRTSELAVYSFKEAIRYAKKLGSGIEAEVAYLYNEAGTVYYLNANLKEAKKCFKKAHEILSNASSNSFLFASTYNNLALCESSNSQYENAIYLCNKSINIKEENKQNIYSELMNLAKYYACSNRISEAEEVYKKATHQCPRTLLHKAAHFLSLGIVFYKAAKFCESAESYKKSLALYFKFYGKGHDNFKILYNEIGMSYFKAKNYKTAIMYFKKRIESNTNPEEVYISQNNIGEAYLEWGKFEDARTYFTKSLELLIGTKQKEEDCAEHYQYCRNQINLSVTKSMQKAVKSR